MLKYSLNGEWQMKSSEETDWMPAKVPGSNYTHLLEAGKIPDPFVGMYEKDVFWVAERDWEYKRTFVLSKDFFDQDEIILHAKMLDTLADVYVNEKLVAKTCNVHIEYAFKIKSFLQEGENEIRILFHSPVEYIKEKQAKDAAPNASMGVDGVPHIRKAQCHFGWDWGPILPISGIIRDIDIMAYKTARITDLKIKQTHTDGKVLLNIDAETEILKDGDFSSELCITTPSGALIKQSGDASASFALEIENPELWWTNDLSGTPEQPLYTVNVALVADGAPLHAAEKKVGLRTLTLDRSADEFGHNFCFQVNGKPIFAKGANWIPADSFIDRFDREKAEYFIRACLDSHMNMIRVWGGGFYESEDFYDLCDRYGILVWQDCCFACAPYPFYNEDFLASVKEEIEFNVKRLRHRASLALWSGNNEIEMMTLGWQLKTQYVKYTEIFFHDILPKWIESLDGVTPFITGSPTGNDEFLKNVNGDNEGDTHLWHVWHGLQPLNYYRKRYTRFCSEYGLESLPDIKTIEFFAKPEDYSLTSDVFMAHQKCLSGNMKMLFYMSEKFLVPKKFEDVVYFSQLIQMICMKEATEHWRRNKGRCNGSLYWQLNDCWPVSSWSGIDYFGRYKALQYGAKQFNAPLMLSIMEEKNSAEFHIVNDTLKDRTLTLKYELLDFEGNVLASGESVESAPACTAKKALSADFKKELKRVHYKAVLVGSIAEDGKIVSEKTVLFKPEKKLNLPKCPIEHSVSIVGDNAVFTLKSERYQRYVWADLKDSYVPFSENCFDLLPGRTKTITIPHEGKDLETLKKAFSLKSVADVEPKGGALGDKWMRFKIRIVPINIGNWFYYHIV